MQAKDVPEQPILDYLEKWSRCGFWCLNFGETLNVFLAMPPETPYKVGLAKMRSLIKRGLVIGCPCGCRGDYHVESFYESELRLRTRIKA